MVLTRKPKIPIDPDAVFMIILLYTILYITRGRDPSYSYSWSVYKGTSRWWHGGPFYKCVPIYDVLYIMCVWASKKCCARNLYKLHRISICLGIRSFRRSRRGSKICHPLRPTWSDRLRQGRNGSVNQVTHTLWADFHFYCHIIFPIILYCHKWLPMMGNFKFLIEMINFEILYILLLQFITYLFVLYYTIYILTIIITEQFLSRLNIEKLYRK